MSKRLSHCLSLTGNEYGMYLCVIFVCCVEALETAADVNQFSMKCIEFL